MFFTLFSGAIKTADAGP